jgi:2-amino-4-hydroxy-6-hydroxymethyldihydropteridine diphosphokinase
MKMVFLSLGSNMGDRLKNLSWAVSLIERDIGDIIVCSSVYETEPWGFQSEEQFLNQVLKVETTDQLSEVLKKINALEVFMGRVRKTETYTSRIIDIDILFCDDMIVNRKSLVIPHPRLHLRNFTLVPLVEIAGEFIHPVFRENLIALATKCTDMKKVRIYSKPPCSKFDAR